jgi:small conductance mechanosensitive channel
MPTACALTDDGTGVNDAPAASTAGGADWSAKMMLAEFSALEPEWVRFSLAVLAAVGVAYLAGEAAARTVRWVFLSLADQEDTAGFASPIVRRPIRIVRMTVTAVAAALLVAPALRAAGAEIAFGMEPKVLVGWVLTRGLRIVTIAVLAFTALRIGAAAVDRLERNLTGAAGAAPDDRSRRARTLCVLARRVLNAVIGGVAALMILREAGLDVTPILAGAGVVGLAVGFGAQTLVRDLISGVFMILEDQIRVGDVAVIDGTGGLVESIGLRTTVLRDLSGVVHVFPNGSIARLSNMTKEFSYAVLDVGVAYKEDTDRVVGVLRAVGGDLRDDPEFGAAILEPLEVLGVDGFGDSQVTIKIRFKTMPLEQWRVGRELRRRIKKAFDAQGIEIPFPHVSVYFGEASRPFTLDVASRRDADAPGA